MMFSFTFTHIVQSAICFISVVWYLIVFLFTWHCISCGKNIFIILLVFRTKIFKFLEILLVLQLKKGNYIIFFLVYTIFSIIFYDYDAHTATTEIKITPVRLTFSDNNDVHYTQWTVNRVPTVNRVKM